MKKVFWDNPYQTVLNTKVKEVNGAEVLFEQTIAYSFSGGQESDLVHINQLQVFQTGFFDEITQRRYWKIDGFAEVHCGGTHVRSTKEVGMVNLKRVNPGKGIQRIEIRLAE